MRKWLLLLGGGLVALLIVITGISTLSTQLQKRHQKQLATTFVQDILANNSQASYAAFSSDAQKSQSQDSWNAIVQKLSSFFKGQTPQFQSITQSKTTAVANYAISGKDGDYVVSVTLLKSKAGWQVSTFNSQLKVE